MSSHSHPIIAPKTYAVVYVVLLGLTALTVWLTNAPLGPLHIPVALAIAGTKAVLVALIFMHGWYSPRLIWLIAAGGLLFLAILYGLTWADYATRGGPWLPETGVPAPRVTR